MSNFNQSTRLADKIRRGKRIVIYFNGNPLEAYEGETIATALTAAGHMVLQVHDDNELGVFCNIGMCNSCLVKVDNRCGVKACSTLVSEGQQIEVRKVSLRKV